jgi:hypothetical protein
MWGKEHNCVPSKYPALPNNRLERGLLCVRQRLLSYSELYGMNST